MSLLVNLIKPMILMEKMKNLTLMLLVKVPLNLNKLIWKI